jgi:hypothetical protein
LATSEADLVKAPERELWPLWPRPGRLAEAGADAAADAAAILLAAFGGLDRIESHGFLLFRYFSTTRAGSDLVDHAARARRSR